MSDAEVQEQRDIGAFRVDAHGSHKSLRLAQRHYSRN